MLKSFQFDMENKKKKRISKSLPRIKKRKKASPYLKYRSVHAGAAPPETPLYRFETSRFGYYAFRYLLPACLACTYIIVLFDNYRLYQNNSGVVTSLAFCFLHPIQIVCVLLLVPVVMLVKPLSHIIICEEGMFVSHGLSRLFVPWNHIRSYHPSRYVNPYVILISYYISRKRHRRIYAITSLETQHTMIEIMSFIHKVRHTAEGEL
jgi:hypothetical protein